MVHKSMAVPKKLKDTTRLENPPRKDPPRKDPPRKDPLTETIRKYFPETWIWDLVTVKYVISICRIWTWHKKNYFFIF